MIARVTGIAPLLIREDAAMKAVPATLGVSGFTPTVGDRVLVWQEGRRLIVVCGLPS